MVNNSTRTDALAAPSTCATGSDALVSTFNFGQLPELMRPAVLAAAIDPDAVDTVVQRLAKTRVEGGADAIPFIRWGRSIFYRRCDVEAFFASRLLRSTSDTGPEAQAAA
jgi:hypothetical protein